MWLSVFLNGELVGGQVQRSTSLLENKQAHLKCFD